MDMKLWFVSLVGVCWGLPLRVVFPSIGSGRFDAVEDFGAVGDGESDDTLAIQSAFDGCKASEGGGVVVLAKEFVSLPLTLKGATGCALEISGRLTQKYWNSTKGDPPTSGIAPPPSLGSTSTHFLNIDDVSEFAIYGGGVVDGNGPLWWPYPDQRPRLLNVKNSKNVALYDVSFYNSPDHSLEMYADNVEIANVTVSVDWLAFDGNAPNTDGIDVHGSPFFVHDSHIDVGDDNLAIHASDLLVEDCTFGSWDHPGVHGHGASIGSLGSNVHLRNITVRNSKFLHTHVGPNIKVQAGATNGLLRDVLYENLILDTMQLYDLRISVDYGGTTITAKEDDDKKGQHTTTLENRLSSSDDDSPWVLTNITYRNITTTNSKIPGELHCSSAIPCSDLHFEDLTSDGVQSEDWQCSYAFGKQTNVDPEIPCLRAQSSFSYSYDDEDTSKQEQQHASTPKMPLPLPLEKKNEHRGDAPRASAATPLKKQEPRSSVARRHAHE